MSNITNDGLTRSDTGCFRPYCTYTAAVGVQRLKCVHLFSSHDCINGVNTAHEEYSCIHTKATVRLACFYCVQNASVTCRAVRATSVGRSTDNVHVNRKSSRRTAVSANLIISASIRQLAVHVSRTHNVTYRQSLDYSHTDCSVSNIYNNKVILYEFAPPLSSAQEA